MTHSDSSNWNVLVAEDSVDARTLLRMAFQKVRAKAQLHFAEDGVKAIEYLQGSGVYADRVNYPSPSLLLLDVNMPRKDGFAVLRWIRANPDLKHMIVVMLTSSDEPTDIRTAYNLGANSYLVKSLMYPEFTHLMECMDTYWLKHNRTPPFK